MPREVGAELAQPESRGLLSVLAEGPLGLRMYPPPFLPPREGQRHLLIVTVSLLFASAFR